MTPIPFLLFYLSFLRTRDYVRILPLHPGGGGGGGATTDIITALYPFSREAIEDSGKHVRIIILYPLFLNFSGSF